MSGMGGHDDRIAAASDWFSRMRGPEADRLRSEFEAWFQNPENAKAYQELEAIWQIAGKASPKGRPSTSAPKPAHWPRVALIAAVLAATVMLGFAIIGRQQTGTALAKQEHFAAGLGAIREITLPDGSKVTLDTQSRLTFHTTASTREIILESGRARFAVAHDRGRPFIVFARGSAIVATGTLFDVRIDGAAVEVTLLEGGVELQRRSIGSMPKRLARLHPGERAIVGEVPEPKISEVAKADEWTSGILEADRLPLAVIVAEANRYGAKKIVLADPLIGRLRVSGAFRPQATEELAASLAAALDLRLERRADGTITLAPQLSQSR